MKRLVAFNVLAAAILLNPFTVSAISSVNDIAGPTPGDLRKELQEEARLEKQAKMEQKIASNAARLEKMAQNKEQAIASKEAKLQNRIADTKAKIASREAAFKEKVAKFKDQERADLASKININLNLINQNRTQALNKQLNTMTEILTRLQGRVDELGANGTDVSSANTAIQQAQVAVDKAKDAVNTQSEQDYNIVVTSETKVGDDAKTTRNKLMSDLTTTFQLVKDAKQAVVNAIQVAVSLGGKNGSN